MTAESVVRRVIRRARFAWSIRTMDPALRSFIASQFDAAVYVDLNPDVGKSDADPLVHWLSHGIGERRRISAVLFAAFRDEKDTSLNSAILTFRWAGRRAVICAERTEASTETTQSHPPLHLVAAKVDPTVVNRGVIGVREEDGALFEFMMDRFDAPRYLAANPDVKTAGVDPAYHYFNAGIFEGRKPFPGVMVQLGRHLGREQPPWRHFSWRGHSVALQETKVPPAIVNEIRSQSRFDPAVVSAGAKIISGLPVYEMTDLWVRDAIDVAGLGGALPIAPDTVILISSLVVGGAEKYVSDIAGHLSTGLGREVAIIVTDQPKSDSGDWRRFEIFRPIANVPITFWGDFTADFAHHPRLMASLLNAMKPKEILVVNSKVGLDALARSGTALSQTSRLYAAFFSVGPVGEGFTYGEIYPRRIASCTTLLTDNMPMKRLLDQRYSPLGGPGSRLLPPKVPTIVDNEIRPRISARLARWQERGRTYHWVWVSRLEPLKGTRVLGEIARQRPRDRFDVYGPASQPLAELGLDLPNIRYGGVIENVTAENFLDFDGFLFTSRFEGMPNVALEMSQQALPLILSDVGGLRDTFGDAAVYVENRPTASATAAAFSVAMDGLLRAQPLEMSRMLETARLRVLAKHGEEAFNATVAEVFGK